MTKYPDLERLSMTLGANISERYCFVQLYIPTLDQHGMEVVDHQRWVERAETLLATLFGGATRESDSDGIWRNPDTGEIIREKTARINSFTEADVLVDALPTLREFLHLFGYITKQGEVAIEINRSLLGITEFDDFSTI